MRRNTQQRAAIDRALADAGRPLSPLEILNEARRFVPDIGIATVYRAIKDFLAMRKIVAVDVPGAPPRYEAAGKPHHHHFLCRQCDRLIDLPGCPGPFTRMLPPGYLIDEHELTLIGRCADCATPKARGHRRRRVRQ
jgi:Fur family ferric uptake transcriptional regulator